MIFTGVLVLLHIGLSCQQQQQQQPQQPQQSQHGHYYPPTDHTLGDDEIVKRGVQELHDIDAATDLNECLTCKTRLQVGKFLALTRPDLVPQVFSTWCVELGHDEVQCHMNYGYPDDQYSATGNDFTKMVSLMNPSGLDGDYFCYYHDKKCHVLPETPMVDMSNMWPPKPRNYLPPDSSGEVFHVLHISDINLQLDYEVFGEANCTQSLCCTSRSRNLKHQAPSVNENADMDGYYDSSYSKNHFEKGRYLDITKIKKPTWSPARQFGEYTCDTPTLLLNSTMQCIRDLHQNHLSFEFAIFTGGTVDHSDRSFMTKDKIIKSQETSYKILKHYLDNVDVIPTFGTRDVFPMNQLPQKNLSVNSNVYQWQFDLLADIWLELGWIDHETAKQIRYTQTGFSLKTSLGLKIISLNSNVWNVKNLYAFWNVLNVDSYGVWKFLINELLESERNHERVWIIAHLPPNHQSLALPTKVLTQIIARFSPKVIAAVFFGCIQLDSFIVQYGGDGTNERELQNAFNHALIGPLISPYGGVIPAWRYYAVDKQSFSITNSFTYYTKLSNSFRNDGAEPNWDFAYSARDVYDPDQLWPLDWGLSTEWWHHVANRISTNPELELLYQRLETRWSPYTFIDKDNHCKVTSFSLEARKQCMITEDQDDYVEPVVANDYIPIVHVADQSVEYVEVEPEDKCEGDGEEDDDEGEENLEKNYASSDECIEEENNSTTTSITSTAGTSVSPTAKSATIAPTPKGKNQKVKGKSLHLKKLSKKVNYAKQHVIHL